MVIIIRHKDGATDRNEKNYSVTYASVTENGILYGMERRNENSYLLKYKQHARHQLARTQKRFPFWMGIRIFLLCFYYFAVIFMILLFHICNPILPFELYRCFSLRRFTCSRSQLCGVENDKSWAARAIMILSALPVFIHCFVLHDELVYVYAFHVRKTKIPVGSAFHLVDNKSLRAHLTSGWEEIQFWLFMFIFASYNFVSFFENRTHQPVPYGEEKRSRCCFVFVFVFSRKIASPTEKIRSTLANSRKPEPKTKMKKN